MAYEGYNEETKVDHVKAPWEIYMKEGDFVSYMPSYRGNKYLDLFEERCYKNDKFADITYYVYDPTKNGYDPNGKYPLLVFLHGYTNALDGIVCVSHSGAEMFASPEHQATIGGAYILVPLANERKDDKGEVVDSWDETYLPHLRNIIEQTKNENPAISKVAIGGGSSGGWMTWNMIGAYPELFVGAFPCSGTAEYMSKCLNTKMKILFAVAKHDEFGVWERITENDLHNFENANNIICYFPELLRNGDGGVASLNFGIEMGQHCMITQLQANFMYDDGTPYIEELPDGMAGWFRDL